MMRRWLMPALMVIVSALCFEALILCVIVAARINAWSLSLDTLTSPIVRHITYGTLPPAKRRIYLFSIGSDFGAHEYINPEGYIVGVGPDLIELICPEAEIDCRTVWTRYDRCWLSRPGYHPVGGEGLHGRWFDACIGWYNTVERAQIFQFSMPYFEAQDTFFFFETGSSFDGENITGKKIGFLSGWASDETCLARQSKIKGRVLLSSQIDYSITIAQALKKLKDKKVDAILLPYQGMRQYLIAGKKVSYFQTLPMTCMLAGNSIMAQKTSDLPAKWNVGFHKVRNTVKFSRFCERANVKHGHRGIVACLPSF